MLPQTDTAATRKVVGVESRPRAKRSLRRRSTNPRGMGTSQPQKLWSPKALKFTGPINLLPYTLA